MPESRSQSWQERKLHDRATRARQRQLDYQEEKARRLETVHDELSRNTFLRAQLVRKKISDVRPISPDDRIVEVGGGAHGLAFGLGSERAVAIDPLAVDYKRLFPDVQKNAVTVAAIGEELPFADEAFDIVLSDNVIDHAERPLEIIDELIRVLKPGGVLFFTVNVHHPIYETASRAHGLWNALGLKLELSAFADHTVHFSEERIAREFSRKPLEIVSQTSTVRETRALQRALRPSNPDALLKKIFFKNALFELIAVKR